MRIYPVIQITAIGLALAGLPSPPAQAENFERGQSLFEDQCRGCHGDLRFADQESKVKTLEALRKKIAGWADHSGTEWGSSEVDDVLLYMNKSFYHLKGAEF